MKTFCLSEIPQAGPTPKPHQEANREEEPSLLFSLFTFLGRSHQYRVARDVLRRRFYQEVQGEGVRHDVLHFIFCGADFFIFGHDTLA